MTNNHNTPAVRCIAEEWDADGSVAYDSVADFLLMCRSVHGEAPDLYETSMWDDGTESWQMSWAARHTGRTVLVLA